MSLSTCPAVRAAGAAALALSVAACQASGQTAASPSPGAAAGSLQTDDQKTIYTLGIILGKNVANLSLTPEELALVQKGLHDAASGKTPEVDLQVYGPKVQQLAQSRMAAGAQAAQAQGQQFLDKAAQEQGAVKTPSGMVHTTLTAGTGPNPQRTDTVRVHYRGTLTNGTEFDRSHKRGQPAEFALNGVIPCWTEGVSRMKVGEKARLVCPPALAYGERGAPPDIPGNSTLVFEVELLDLKK